MKRFLSVAAILAATTAHAGGIEPWQERAVELAEGEPKVIDATWSQDISFWVTTSDDGSNRDGFASYLCLILMDAGKPKGEFVAVTVWDAATEAPDSPRRLGKAYCQ